MANYAEHVLIRWGGKLAAEETWSCGLRLQGMAGSDDVTTAQGNLEDFAELVRLFCTNSQSWHNGLCSLDWVKANAIGPDGKYSQAYTNLHEFSPAIDLGTGAAPSQLAVAVTLRTAVSRGRAHAGRFYIPTGFTTVQADGRMGQADAQNIAGAAAAFIQGINVQVTGYKVAVFSPLEPIARAVTRVEVGRVVDTQRRRRNQLAEDYVGVDL